MDGGSKLDTSDLHIRVACGAVGVPQALLLEAKKRARASGLDRNLSVESGVVWDGDLEDASEKMYEDPIFTEEEAVGMHRASVVADLAPNEAKAKKNEGKGWGLEADPSTVLVVSDGPIRRDLRGLSSGWERGDLDVFVI